MIIAKKAPKAERQLLKDIFQVAMEAKRAEMSKDGLTFCQAQKQVRKLTRQYQRINP